MCTPAQPLSITRGNTETTETGREWLSGVAAGGATGEAAGKAAQGASPISSWRSVKGTSSVGEPTDQLQTSVGWSACIRPDGLVLTPLDRSTDYMQTVGRPTVAYAPLVDLMVV